MYAQGKGIPMVGATKDTMLTFKDIVVAEFVKARKFHKQNSFTNIGSSEAFASTLNNAWIGFKGGKHVIHMLCTGSVLTCILPASKRA